MLTARIVKQHNGCYLIFIENEEHTADIIEVEKVEIIDKTSDIIINNNKRNSEVRRKKGKRGGKEVCFS